MSVEPMLSETRARAGMPLRLRGSSRLAGSVEVQGAKNTALKVLPALVAHGARYELHRTPILLDTLEQLNMLERLGARVDFGASGGAVSVDTCNIQNDLVPYDLTRRTTASFYIAGALLHRFGEARVGLPGGDEIGPRPVDLHVNAFRALGAVAFIEDNVLNVRFTQPPSNRVSQLDFGMPSAGATVNALLASFGDRPVRVAHPPKDSDTRAFFDFLSAVGVQVGISDEAVELRRSGSRPERVAFAFPADRNDTVTWMTAGALSDESVTITGVDAEDVASAIKVWQELGANVSVMDEGINVRRGRLEMPRGFVVAAGPSPGFHSDWAPLLQVVMSQASGQGMTVDTLHASRVRQAELLGRMGAQLEIRGGEPPAGLTPHFRSTLDTARYIVDIRGPSSLRGVTAAIGNDVRACAAVCLAAAIATGPSTLTDIEALTRGYESFVSRLQQLGADIDEGEL